MARSAAAVVARDAPPITREEYSALREAFLRLGPRFPQVARQCGVPLQMAKRAWDRGFPDLRYDPLHLVYSEALERLQRVDLSAARDNLAASADGRDASQIRPDLSPDDAALQQEQDLIMVFRRNLVASVQSSANVLRGLDALSVSVGAAIARHAESMAGDLFVNPDVILKPMEQFAKITQILVGSAKGVMEMQRLLWGAPQHITEHRGIAPDAGPTDETLQRLGGVLSMMQRSGLLPNQPDAIDATCYDAAENATDAEKMARQLTAAADASKAELARADVQEVAKTEFETELTPGKH